MRNGMDVSGWQGVINWDIARSKVVFAFIKAVEGVWTDRQFQRNWVEAYRVGVQRGAYLFYRANVDAGQQVRALIESLAGDYGELPIAVDLEDEQCASPWDEQQIADLRWCLDSIERFTGRRPVIYTARWWASPYLGYAPWLMAYPLWVANYVASPDVAPVMPTEWATWKYFQWTSAGNGAEYGVQSDYIDLDVEAPRPVSTPRYSAFMPTIAASAQTATETQPPA